MSKGRRERKKTAAAFKRKKRDREEQKATRDAKPEQTAMQETSSVR